MLPWQEIKNYAHGLALLGCAPSAAVLTSLLTHLAGPSNPLWQFTAAELSITVGLRAWLVPSAEAAAFPRATLPSNIHGSPARHSCLNASAFLATPHVCP